MGSRGRSSRASAPAAARAWHDRPRHDHHEGGLRVPPISELTRIEPVHLGSLAAHGIFTTGLLLEVSETPTRRQYLADQVDATIIVAAERRGEAVRAQPAGCRPDERGPTPQGARGSRPAILQHDPEA